MTHRRPLRCARPTGFAALRGRREPNTEGTPPPAMRAAQARLAPAPSKARAGRLARRGKTASRLDPRQPRRALVDQRLAQAGQRTQLTDLRRRNPRLGQASLLQQQPQPARILTVGLGPLLASPPRPCLGHPARCATAPARASASHTNNQPVHASTATCISHSANPATHSSTASGDAPILPRASSPVSLTSASKMIWARCTSKPAVTIPIGPPSCSKLISRTQCRPLNGWRPASSCHLFLVGRTGEVASVCRGFHSVLVLARGWIHPVGATRSFFRVA